MARPERPTFTPNMIKRLPTDGDGSLIYDGATPGLCIRCRKTNVYYYTYKFHGAKRWLQIGDVNDITLDDARAAAIVARGRVRNGDDPCADKQADKQAAKVEVVERKVAATKTVDAMLDDYIELALPKRKPRTVKEYTRIIEKRIRPAIGKKLAAEITLTDVERLHLSLKDTKTEANRTVAVLSAAFTWGGKHGWPKPNPCQGVEKFGEKGPKNYLADTQLAALVAALDAEPAARKYEAACVRFIVATGARLTEARTLKWSAVDIDGRKATLKEHKTDGTIGEKDITFPADIAELLRSLAKLKRSDVVFDPGGVSKGGADKDGFIPERRIERCWHRVRKASGIKAGIRIHDLRHSYITLAIAKGVGVATVSTMVGHANIATTMEYVRLLQETADDAAATVAAAIARKRTPKQPAADIECMDGADI